VIATLVSHAAFARQLLEAVRDGKISRHDISAFDARQIHSFGDPQLDQLLTEVWGEYHPGGKDTQAKIAAWRAKLTPARMASANYQHGHEMFLKTCGICHRLYGEGAFIGPDLTGAGRADLGYLLENILDPSAVVAADYKMSIVELKDDRVLTGIIGEKKEHTFTMKTPTGSVMVQRDDVTSITASPLSMMPDGLLDTLTESEVADLIYYLMPVKK
jgi:putative heme-binding domain-containing protein